MSSITDIGVRGLRNLTADEFREFFHSFDVILCDCDGVIWMMLGLIPGAGEALQLLKDKGKQVKFVSNNSMRGDEEYLEKFKKCGIKDVIEDDVVHPAKTMAWYFKKHNPNGTAYPLIARPAIDILIKNGVKTVPLEMDAHKLNCAEFTKYILQHDQEKVTAVMVDLNLYTNFTHIVKALQYLKDDNCDLLLGAMDSVVRLTENLYIPGFVDVYDTIMKHSNKEPVILAKPSPVLGELLKEHYSIADPKRCLFIGDSLRQDIGFGKSLGFQTLLVLSGVDTKECMLNAPAEEKPDYYTASLADLTSLLENIS